MLRPLFEGLTNITHRIELLKQQEDQSIKALQSEIEQVKKASEEKPYPTPEPEKDDSKMQEVLAVLAQTQAVLAQVMSKPRQTKIIEDENGKAIGAVSTTKE